MNDPQALQREGAYLQGVLQSLQNIPGREMEYRNAERRLMEINNMLQFQHQQQYFASQQPNTVYRNTNSGSYGVQNSFNTTYNPYDTVSNSSGINTTNSRYNRYKDVTPTTETKVVIETPTTEIKPLVPETGSEYPFILDEYTISNMIEDNGKYKYVLSKTELYDRHDTKSFLSNTVEGDDLLTTMNQRLLEVNMSNHVLKLDNLSVKISECLTEDKLDVDIRDFKLTDSQCFLDYPDELVKPVDLFLTKIYNIQLARELVQLDVDNIREDLNELEEAEIKLKINGFSITHAEVLEEIDDWIGNGGLKYSNDDEKGTKHSIYVNIPSILIPTKLGVSIKSKHPNNKFLYLSKKSYRELYDAMNSIGDDKCGVLWYRSYTGGIEYYLFLKSQYISYIVAV